MKNMCNGVPIQKRNVTIHVPCLWIQRLLSPRILIRLILSVLIYKTTINFVWYCKKIKRLTAIVLPWPVSCASASVQWPLGVGKGSTHGMQSVNNNKCIDLSGQSSGNSSVWRIIPLQTNLWHDTDTHSRSEGSDDYLSWLCLHRRQK